jgi:putative flippase GtrA
MIEHLKNLVKKHSEIIAYLFFGGLTVLFNMVIYYFTLLFTPSDIVANSIAYVLSVLFAYFTNSRFVFRKKMQWKSFLSFFGMRIGIIFVDNGGLWFLLHIGLNRFVSKSLSAAIVIILNYIFSKFFIFKEKKN